MLKQVLFIFAAGIIAAVITGPAHAVPFKDIVLPEMIDEAAAGVDLPGDR
jgi:hypothetical protein